MTIAINYWAVIVAAIVNIVLGFIWYGPLLGKPWMKLSGINVDTKPSSKVMTMNMIIMIIGSFLMAWVLDHALIFGNAYLQTSGVSAGLMVGFFNWLGFVAPITIGSVLWENKSWSLWFINAGYYLVSFCLMGVILAAWM